MSNPLTELKNNRHNIEFKCSDGQRIIPYLHFKWHCKTFLSEIILGPDNVNEVKHIGMLLDEHGFQHVTLRKSNIPYKNYK
jgi:hypothetical protein